MDNNQTPLFPKGNDGHVHYEDNDPVMEFPPYIDPLHPPVRNDDNESSHHQPGDHQGGGEESGSDPSDIESGYYYLSGHESDMYDNDDDSNMDEYQEADEGAEEHLLQATRERHNTRLRIGILPDDYDVPGDFHAPSAAGHISPGAASMIVEANMNSDDSSVSPSMTSSLMSHISRGSSAFGEAGGWIDPRSHVYPPGFAGVGPKPSFLRLTSEARFERPFDMGKGH